MKIAAGPWLIKGRGYVVLPALDSGECLEVGDRLRRADGATWTFSGVESRAKDGTCLLRGDVSPSLGDELLLAHVIERTAWARLVRAEVDAANEYEPWPFAPTLAERDAARQALRALGVDVDALLGPP